jgi:uncharacterized protein YndB with AHSA1/START domain
MSKEINQSWFFAHSPQEVWEYLTEATLLEQWLMKSDFRPVVGHKFRFVHAPKNESNYDGVVHGEVLEVDRFAKLSYSWNVNMKDKSRTMNSTVAWTLTPKDNGTELQLRHSGFSVLEDFTSHNEGWKICVGRLEEVLMAVHH